MTAPAIHVAYSRWKKQVTARAYIWENGYAHTMRTKTDDTKEAAHAAVLASVRESCLAGGYRYPDIVVPHGFIADILKHDFGPDLERRR